jgi:isopentenyl-diphosphate Delta-isomerase
MRHCKASSPQILENNLSTTSLSGAEDPTAASRKRDHIELAFKSQVGRAAIDRRFFYEPLLSAHPVPGSLPPVWVGGKKMWAPLWISSMTGGTEKALTINHNLARACGEFGLGMGLGSCRPLLYSDERLGDFAVRSLLGPGQPLYANLGIAQLEELIDRGELTRLTDMLGKLEADGLIIHVNPLQEWMQPEGDRFRRPPIDTIEQVIAFLGNTPVIVKEVGQGMGYSSLRTLLQLPLAALDFGAAGDTNFAQLELNRSQERDQHPHAPVALVGHDAEDMTRMTQALIAELGEAVRCEAIIVSGGVHDFLDGYYYTRQLSLPAVYGQASAFLRHAQADYAQLQAFVISQISGLELAYAYLKVRPSGQ